MTRLFQISILSLFVFSCTNKTYVDNGQTTYLDSLINFDTIVSIYSYETTPHSDEDTLPDNVILLNEQLYADSTRRKWTMSKEVIRNFRLEFPRIKEELNPNWDTTCLWWHEYLIVTKTKMHVAGWLMTNKDSLLAFDDKSYRVKKGDMEKLRKILDRRIILKEIHQEDSLYYNLTDFYNRHYATSTNYFGQKKMWVYVVE